MIDNKLSILSFFFQRKQQNSYKYDLEYLYSKYFGKKDYNLIKKIVLFYQQKKGGSSSRFEITLNGRKACFLYYVEKSSLKNNLKWTIFFFFF